ncbi:MAG TPA: AsnC family transcriptional regulator [Nitrososphaeraceae archaeon]|jgi:Lrp/AsnC family leucine-responsive transcriptional regulator
MQQTALDKIDLKIINLLSGDCRVSYRNIALTVGITPNAVKTRVNKLIFQEIIQRFVVRVNPVIFGYKKECILTMRHVNKNINENDILNRLNLIGNVFVHAKQLGGTFIFLLEVKTDAEEKIGLLIDLLKPAIVETIFVDQKPVSININISDLKIIKCLLSNARMDIADIARQASISKKTVTRRIEKMQQNHILEFTILRNMSSTQLVGYIEFAVIIKVDRSLYRRILERIYRELQEYLMIAANMSQSNVIFAVFFCPNIPSVDSILTQIASYDGVEENEVFITTKLTYYQEWLKVEIDKSLRSQSMLQSLHNH